MLKAYSRTMLVVVHMLAGAVVGLAFDDIATVAVISFFLHYIMDQLPHIDPETFASKKLPYTWKQSSFLVTDIILAVLVALLFLTNHERWENILVGSIASLIPDFFIPLERFRLFYPLRKFHRMFHWDRRQAKGWGGYIAGILTPTAVAAVTSMILWWSF